jgi:uncharacterized membrane protein YhiD involved in acid resistance
MQRLIVVGAFIVSVVALIATLSVQPVRAYEMRQDLPKFQKNSALKTMKQSTAWTEMQTQLDQYDAHYIAATNSIAQVTDPKTQTALTKSMRATDDCHDALVKLINCFRDYVQSQGD